uniref:Uncharacterized protein n=1 Tax=Anguilla anguilla TaxID=7936 RepID=A0A0E9TIB8_ANGAN
MCAALFLDHVQGTANLSKANVIKRARVSVQLADQFFGRPWLSERRTASAPSAI